MENAMVTKQNKGFTLLELLVVVGIIGILMAIAAVSFAQAQKKARDNRRRSDLRAIQNALEQYYSDNNSAYPAYAYSSASFSTYLPNSTTILDPKGNCTYQYSSAIVATGYEICADLEIDTFNACLDYDYCVKNLQ